jgi:hypothetical protein
VVNVALLLASWPRQVNPAKEPLLHFLLLGAALFGAYALLNRGTQTEPQQVQVRISEGDVQWLKETWARQWQREPTRDELRGLVTEYLKEELLSREAREMGLDQNDTYVRRRLAQKVEFLVQDASRLAEPTEDDLRTFYAAHPELFSEDARVSFTQVYFSREHRAGVAAARARLEASANPTELGDRLMVGSEFHDASEQTVAGQFGAEFARAVFALQPGAWHGPIESAYGLHLVRVSEKKSARPRAFAEVRAQALERWHDLQQRDNSERYFAGLLKKYDVVVDENVKPLVGTVGATEVSR